MGKPSSNTTVSNNSPPQAYLDAYSAVNKQAQNVASQPYSPYQGNIVAGFSPDQTAAMQQVEGATANGGVQAPYLQAAQQAFTNAQTPLWPNVQQFSPQSINQYTSPYTQQVVNATENQFNNQNAIQNQGVVGNAISQGGWGGDRSAVAQAITAGQQQTAEAPVIAGLENQGYSQALQEFNQQQGTQLGANEANAWLGSQAGFGESALGNEAQQTALTGAGALQGVGGMQQQYGQELLNVPYEQNLAAQAYPFQTTGWLANIAEGLGGASGGTSSTTTPGPSTASQLAGLGTGAVGVLGATGAFGSNGYLTNAFNGSAAPAGAAAYNAAQAAGGANFAMDAAGNIPYQSGGMIPAHRAPGGSVPDVSLSIMPGQFGMSASPVSTPSGPDSIVPGASGMGAAPATHGTSDILKNYGTTSTTTPTNQDSVFGSILKDAGIIAASIYGTPAAGMAASALSSQVHFAKGGHVEERAMGGMSMSDESPWWERSEARSATDRHGLLTSPVAGRTDHLPISPAAGSYVVPADVVSGLGEGNTLAGANIMQRILDTGPMGLRMPVSAHSHMGPPRPPPAYREGMGDNGMATGGVVQRRADGGSSNPVSTGGPMLNASNQPIDIHGVPFNSPTHGFVPPSGGAFNGPRQSSIGTPSGPSDLNSSGQLNLPSGPANNLPGLNGPGANTSNPDYTNGHLNLPSGPANNLPGLNNIGNPDYTNGVPNLPSGPANNLPGLNGPGVTPSNPDYTNGIPNLPSGPANNLPGLNGSGIALPGSAYGGFSGSALGTGLASGGMVPRRALGGSSAAPMFNANGQWATTPAQTTGAPYLGGGPANTLGSNLPVAPPAPSNGPMASATGQALMTNGQPFPQNPASAMSSGKLALPNASSPATLSNAPTPAGPTYQGINASTGKGKSNTGIPSLDAYLNNLELGTVYNQPPAAAPAASAGSSSNTSGTPGIAGAVGNTGVVQTQAFGSSPAGLGSYAGTLSNGYGVVQLSDGSYNVTMPNGGVVANYTAGTDPASIASSLGSNSNLQGLTYKSGLPAAPSPGAGGMKRGGMVPRFEAGGGMGEDDVNLNVDSTPMPDLVMPPQPGPSIPGGIYAAQPGAISAAPVAEGPRHAVPTERRGSYMPPPPQLAAYVQDAAARHGVDPKPLAWLLSQESHWNPSAYNPESHTMGIGQFKAATAREVGIDPWDPKQAIDGSAAYLRKMLDKTGGDYESAIGRYGTFSTWHGKDADNSVRNQYRAFMGAKSGGRIGHFDAGGAPSGDYLGSGADDDDMNFGVIRNEPVGSHLGKMIPRSTPDPIQPSILRGIKNIFGGIDPYKPLAQQLPSIDWRGPAQQAADKARSQLPPDANGAVFPKRNAPPSVATSPVPEATGNSLVGPNAVTRSPQLPNDPEGGPTTIGGTTTTKTTSGGPPPPPVPPTTSSDAATSARFGIGPSTPDNAHSGTDSGTSDTSGKEAIKPSPWEALMAAGFAMAAGKSPHALENIGAGGLAGVKDWQQQKQLAIQDQMRIDQALTNKVWRQGQLGINQQKANTADTRAQAYVKTQDALAGLRASQADNIPQQRAINQQNANTREAANAIAQQRANYMGLGLDERVSHDRAVEDFNTGQLAVHYISAEKNPITGAAPTMEQAKTATAPAQHAAAPALLSMPTSKADLVVGKAYNTARGAATWDGTQFVTMSQ